MKTDFFPYGIQYYRYPAPRQNEWAEDLKQIKEAGYTHIQFSIQWKWAERIEGEYYFDDIDTLMDLAQNNDLKVILHPIIECAPDWIFTKYNGHRIDYKGDKIQPISSGIYYIGGWAPCFDNPTIIEKSSKFVQEIAKRYKDHPALWFYNAWHTPHSKTSGHCHCEHSKIKYRNWLKEKFIKIENINNFFGKAFTSFDTLNPPCASADYMEFLMWKYWESWNVSQHIKNIVDAIKSIDPNKEIMCNVGRPQTINDPVNNPIDDISNKSVVDLYGTSFPINLQPNRNNELAMPLIIADWVKCVDKNFWIHDFNVCPGEWGKTPNPTVLKRTIWQSIATGCTGFTFTQYKNERMGRGTNSWGLKEINGAETERSKICDYIGEKLQKFSYILANSKRKDNVIAQIFHKEQDTLSRLEACKHNYVSEHTENIPYLYQTAIQHHHGIYSSVLINGMDFITWNDDFSKYKVISIVADEIISPNMANKLKEFVKNGGNLIIEFPFASKDISTWVSYERPNNGLDELLGLKEVKRYNEKHSCSYNSAKFDNIPIYIEAEPNPDTEIFGYWDTGKPCGFKHKYGEGMVYSLLASPSAIELGQGYQAIYLAREIYKEMGIQKVLHFAVTLYIREKDNHNIYFLFNYSDTDEEFNVDTSKATIIDKQDTLVTPNSIKVNKGGYIILHD